MTMTQTRASALPGPCSPSLCRVSTARRGVAAARPGVALALLLATTGACSGPQAQIPLDVLARMQANARSEIYDRENDVAIARNHLDDVRVRVAAVQRRITELDESARKLRLRLVKSQTAERAAKVERPLAARRGYLQSQLRLASAQQTVAEAQVLAASGRLEQTRQRELVRTGRALGRTLKPFDRTVESREKRVKADERRYQDMRSDTEKAYETWKGAEGEYAGATGDYDTAVWID